MELYINSIDQYWEALHQRLIRFTNLYTPYEHFHVFGILDDTDLHTALRGTEESMQNRINSREWIDWQRLPYLQYFCFHGLKAQVVVFPDGMVGCIFVTELQQNHNVLIKMSGLNQYLYSILNLLYIHAHLLPALYGDAIFATREYIIGKAGSSNGLFCDKTIALSRQYILIEHPFYCHKNKFKVFTKSWRFYLMLGGTHVKKFITVSFFWQTVIQLLKLITLLLFIAYHQY